MQSYFSILDSNASVYYYELNSVIQFKNKLLNNINLQGTWYVGLCDIQIYKPKKVEVGHSLWIYSDAVVDTQIGDSMAPLLRRVSISNLKKNWLICEFINVYYLQLRSNFIESIKISIKEDISKSFDSFESEFGIASWEPKRDTNTSLTLHFIKC